MPFFKLAKTGDIAESQMKPFDINGKEIILIRYKDKYYAINRRCTHMQGDLSKGEFSDGIITCPKHGSKFDVTTGKVVRGPKIGFLKLKTTDETVYEVKVKDDIISVEM